MTMVFDLQEQRTRALARVRSAISEMEIVRRSMSKESPNLHLVDGLLRSLKKNEATLAAGIVPRRARVER